NPARERGIARQRDDVFVATLSIPRHGHAQCRGERRAGVPRAITIMFALRAQHEAVQAAGGANGVKEVAPAGEQFVYVSLVADVENEMVLGSVEDVMHGEREFHDAEIRAEVAAVFRENGNEFLADFRRELLELREVELLHVRGGADSVK